jgi:hypothetical protein
MSSHEMSLFSATKAFSSLVHKDNADDVFISDCRGALPAWFDITVEQFESSTLSQRNAIEACYVLVDDRHKGRLVWCLSGLPWYIDSTMSCFNPTNSDVTQWLIDWYASDGEGWILRAADISEAMQNTLIKAAGHPPLRDRTRYDASLVLDGLLNIVRAPVFHCSIYNDTKHYYFYNKRHEHVPGIMLMEIARQAFYAHFYRFNVHTRSSVNLSILEFNCDFVSYLQSNYPAYISVETLSRIQEGASREKQHLRATFIQREHVVCVVEMTGVLVPLKLFHKLRDVRPPANDAFAPIPSDTPVRVLLSYENDNFVECRIAEISTDYMLVKAPDNKERFASDKLCRFHLFAPHLEVIIGHAMVDGHAPQDGLWLVRIKDWSKGSASKFREFLKMDCFLIDASPNYAVAAP